MYASPPTSSRVAVVDKHAPQQAATLLSDPARELEQLAEHFHTKWGPPRFTTELGIDELPATNAGWCFFNTDDGRRVVACSSNESVAESDRYYIPVHNYCLSLAKRILASGRGRTCNVRQLWKVLRTRYAWDIPDLTSGVLAQMAPSTPSLDDGDPQAAEFRARFERLPQEMKDHILSFVFAEQHFPPDCTRLIPQTAWMDLLMQGQIVPYLWDLRRDEVEKKVAEGRDRGIEWDFELLVRRLCQSQSMADGAPLSSMPCGLRNRQRIWKLVEDMYVGDFLPKGTLPESRRPAAIPRYWDEEGALQYPLVWIRA
ncbi:hypothetical protein SLS55_003337 [Diplodia seriata]|uniref:Uncharacterized protein n=1 Tax=Diplodia seriata TaxID=420778 RepID=A0ABR3CMW7_9PEZI